MSKSKLKIIRHYLNEHLTKEFIWSNISKAFASILIIRKFENELRICVNYRALNAIIEKRKYSISLINETLIKLFKAKMFIKLNVIHTFNKIKIKKKHEWLIAFNIKYDQFEYLIMLFDFCNASTRFQNYINSILQNFLNHFCTTYINDILIYNFNKKKHAQHVLKILRRLKDRNLQLNINKCAFKVNKVCYLKLIINTQEVKMNSKKMQVIIDWKVSKSMKKVLSFIEIANFYRRFIQDYSKKIKSLTLLTQEEQYLIKNEKRKNRYKNFVWMKKCQKTFFNLKAIFVVASILTHFDVSLKIWLKINASNHVIARIMFQIHENILRSITYFFKKMNSIECNYMIYDKKLLTIIKKFETWRSKLINVKNTIKLYINHKNFEYFMIIKELNRKQARWAKFLSEFDFKIKYRSKKQKKKSDALMKRKQNVSIEVNDSRKEDQRQIVLKDDQLDKKIKKHLFCAYWQDSSREKVLFRKELYQTKKRIEFKDFARTKDRIFIDKNWRSRTRNDRRKHDQRKRKRESKNWEISDDDNQKRSREKWHFHQAQTSKNERRQKIFA
jgi:hypothetical protein